MNFRFTAFWEDEMRISRASEGAEDGKEGRDG